MSTNRLIAAVVAETLIKLLVKIRAAGRASVVDGRAVGCAVRLRWRRNLAPLDIESVHDILNLDERSSGRNRAVAIGEGHGFGKEQTILIIGTAALSGRDEDDFRVLRPALLGVVETSRVESC